MPNPGKELSSIDFASMLGGPLNAVVDAQAKAAMSSVNFIKSVGFKQPPKKVKPGEQATTEEPVYVGFKFPKEVSPYVPEDPGGAITSIPITNPGAGYTTPPAITIPAPGAGGTQATAVATLTADGKLESITITAPGSRYSGTVNVTIEAPPAGGTQAAAGPATLSAKIEAKKAVFEMMQLDVPILTMLPIPYIRVEEVTVDFNAKIDTMESLQIDHSMEYGYEANAGFSYSGFSAGFKASLATQSTTSLGVDVARTYTMGVHIKAVQNELPAGMEKMMGILESTIRTQPVSLAR